MPLPIMVAQIKQHSEARIHREPIYVTGHSSIAIHRAISVYFRLINYRSCLLLV